ncbi:hypothetical protein ES708_31232 [subsurface metagenome]
MVKIPCCFAIFAATEQTPLPVPPPIPAVIKIISAFSRALEILSLSSSAAFLPNSGLPPVPKPLVRDLPI